MPTTLKTPANGGGARTGAPSSQNNHLLDTTLPADLPHPLIPLAGSSAQHPAHQSVLDSKCNVGKSTSRISSFRPNSPAPSQDRKGVPNQDKPDQDPACYNKCKLHPKATSLAAANQNQSQPNESSRRPPMCFKACVPVTIAVPATIWPTNAEQTVKPSEGQKYPKQRLSNVPATLLCPAAVERPPPPTALTTMLTTAPLTGVPMATTKQLDDIMKRLKGVRLKFEETIPKFVGVEPIEEVQAEPKKEKQPLTPEEIAERIQDKHQEKLWTLVDDGIYIHEPPGQIRRSRGRPRLPPLTPAMETLIRLALKPCPPDDVLVDAFNMKVTRRDMQTLCPCTWLNDEIINFYMMLLIERGRRQGFAKVHAFNTFFYENLIVGGHEKLKRWTRKIDLFKMNLVIVPVHLGNHWCIAAVDMRCDKITYFDSLGSPNNQFLEAMLKYLAAESKYRLKQELDVDKWTKENAVGIPQQTNSSDCGVFVCAFAEHICRGAAFNFTQADMPYFRRKMVYEVLTASLVPFR